MNGLELVRTASAPGEQRTRRGPRGGTLRIAVIGPSRHPVAEPFAGGLEAFVHTLVAGLRRRGHEVTLFAGRASPGADRRFPLDSGDWAPSEAARQDRSMPSATFMADHHQHLRLMLALSDQLEGDFDVVHNHSLHHLPVAMSGSVPTAVVTTLHTPPTPWMESAIDAGGDGVAAWTAVSRAMARSWTVLDQRVEVVGNGIDVSRWPAGPGGPRLVWTGRLVPEKGPHLAVRAARLAGLPIDLVGPVGDAPYVRDVLGPELGPDAVHLGHLGQAALARVVGRAAAALVTPRWEEPFGLVAAEAMACGTPVVAFDRGGLAEFVTPPGGVLVSPDDVRAMAEAIPHAVRLDRAVVRSTAVAHVSDEAMLDRYESVYARAISSRVSRSA